MNPLNTAYAKVNIDTDLRLALTAEVRKFLAEILPNLILVSTSAREGRP